MPSKQDAPVLGIDLGTSTCLACMRDPSSDSPIMIIHDPDSPAEVMPSYFCLTEQGPVVGERARQLQSDDRYAKDVVRCVKRSMAEQGKRFHSSGRDYSPTEISSIYLRELRVAAERQLKLSPGAITRAVVTVPAYFGETERHWTIEAARMAGLEPSLLDEPIAAAYGLALHTMPGRRLSLVVDLGGGTLDVTLLLSGTDVEDGGINELGRDGDDKLGGDLWDQLLAKLIVNNCRREDRSYSPSADFFEFNNVQLYSAVELAKRKFSDQRSLEQTIQYLDRETFSRRYVRVKGSEFEQETNFLAESVALVCCRLLENVDSDELEAVRSAKVPWWKRAFVPRPKHLTWDMIDAVYVVGGAGKLPAVRDAIAARWGRQPIVPDRAQHQVAYGASRIAASPELLEALSQGKHLRSPHSVGYFYFPDPRDPQNRKFEPIVVRNQRIPTEIQGSFGTSRSNSRTLVVQLVEQRQRMRYRARETYSDFRDITSLTIENLPPSDERHSASNVVEYEARYHADRTIVFTAHFRGRSEKVDVRHHYQGEL